MSDLIAAQAILESAKELAEVEVIEDLTEGTVLSVPKGRELKSVKPFLDEYLDRPRRRRGTTTHTQLQSFIEHAKRFKDPDSAIFANVTASTQQLIVVYDYNPQDPSKPRFGEHRGVYDFPISREWAAWKAVLGKPMSMEFFASWIEDRITDIIDPAHAGSVSKGFAQDLGIVLATPARILELSKGLTIHVGQKISSAVNLSTGEAQLLFHEEHQAQRKDGGGPVSVPGGFVIAVPVFTAGVCYQLPVRLRYRAKEGEVTWTLVPHQFDRVFDDAVELTCAEAQKQIELPLYYGTPER